MTKTIDFFGMTFNYEDASGNKSKLIGVLSAAEQAVNALEKLADHHEATNKLDDARSNREYVKVIKGQMITHRLVEKELGR